jgi:hypothetical protein
MGKTVEIHIKDKNHAMVLKGVLESGGVHAEIIEASNGMSFFIPAVQVADAYLAIINMANLGAFFTYAIGEGMLRAGWTSENGFNSTDTEENKNEPQG